MFVQSLDCHDFLRSLAVTEYFATPSLRGVKRRSNPGSERWLMDCHVASLLAMTKYRRLPRRPERAPRNDVHTLDCFATLAMTGELIAVLLLAMSRTHPRAYRVLLCKTRDL